MKTANTSAVRRRTWRSAARAGVLVATVGIVVASGSSAFAAPPPLHPVSPAATPVASPGISAPPDVVVGEADGSVTLPVTLNAPGQATVTVNYATADGTASGSNQFCAGATSFYVDQSGTLTFPPGVTTQDVTITVLDCHHSLALGFGTFYLKLTANSVDSTLVRAVTQVDITGDAAATATPGLYVRDATVDASAGTINVPVVLGGPSGASENTPVTVAYTTNDGSARAGTDYTTTSATLTFPPGETAQNITVPLLSRAGPVPARSFTVTLNNPTNATVADDTGVITIGASGTSPVPAPGLSAPPDVVVGATDGYVDLPVTLNPPGQATVTVNYATADGTASGSNQFCAGATSAYVDETGTLTFPPGVTTQTVRVPVLDCHHSLALGFGTFYLKLTANSVDSTLVRAVTQVDITGDAAATATPGLYVRDATVDASAGTINVPVVLGGPSGASENTPVTVAYTTNDGSARAGTDYTTTSATLTFPPGETAQNITVPLLSRAGPVPARSFTVTLNNPTNATVADDTGVITIGASGTSPVPAPGLSAPPDVVVGATDGYVDLPVTLNPPGQATVTVNYATADGTASGSNQFCAGATSAYVDETGTLTFPPGVTTQTVRVPVLDCHHSLALGFGTFYLKLTANSVDSTLVRAVTQVDITGDAAATATPGLYVRDATVDASAGTINVPVVLGGPSGASENTPVTVAYTTNDGSARAGTDYTTTSATLTFPPGETAQNITVPLLSRAGPVPARSFTVTLNNPTNATVADDTGVITIGASGTSPVPAPGLSAPPDVVVGATDGYVDLPVTLNPPGQATVTVNYATADGTASGSNQFCAGATSAYVDETGTLTFPPGVTTQTVRVPVLDCHHSLALGFGTFYLKLTANSVDSTLVRAVTQVDITGDAAATATPGLYVRDATVDASAGTINVPVVLGGPSGASENTPVTVAYTTNDGSARAGTDYTTTSATLTFPPGETAQNITVPLLSRAGPVPARSFTVTLNNPTNATVADDTGVITIGASGTSPVPAPGLSAPPDVVVGATDGYVDLPVTLNPPGQATVTVNYATADGTASGSNQFCAGATSAYVDETGTLTFPPGVTTQTVRVPLLNCNTTTPLTFSFKLSAVTNASIVRPSTTVTIVANPGVPGTPTGVSAVAGNQLAVVTFTSPASNGGNPINFYTVTASPGGATGSGPSSPITVGGLTNGTSYTFTVSATNDVGPGPASAASNAVIPLNIGPPAKLVFAIEPSNAAAAKTLPVQPTVEIEDAVGNVISTDSNAITLAITAGTGTAGAVLSGCSSATISGVAAFNGCQINLAGAGYKLTASDTTDSLSATSTTFDVSGGGLTAVTPARIMDTRHGTGGTAGPVAPGQTVPLTVTGAGNVPTKGVGAVVLNVTVTQPTASGFLTVYPKGAPTRPTTSNLNFLAHQTVPNLVIAPVGSNGVVEFYNGSAGTVQIIADVSGWFASGSPGAGGLTPLTPARIMDTRNKTGGTAGPVAPGQTVPLTVTGGPIPTTGVAAVVLNVTVTQPTASGFLTVYPKGAPTRPTTSNLNFLAHQTVPNLVIAPVGTNGVVEFYNGSAGTVQIIADVSGWFASGSPGAGGLTPLTPARIMDTRNKTGGTAGPVAPGQTVPLTVTGGPIPTTGVAAVVLNVTVTQPTASGFLTVYPKGAPTRPTTSNLNFLAHQTVPNLVIAPVGTNGVVEFYNGSAGTVQIIADVSGWFSS